MKKYLLVCLLALAAAWAHAGVGMMEIPGLGGDGPVTVFYPSSAADAPLHHGPFTLQVAWKGEPARGNGRLIVISHGSGGSPDVHSDLARLLVQQGFMVAMPEHAGDNYKDISHPGPTSWKLRPLEVSRAIDAVAGDARFAPLLSLDKVGMYGMSAGGHTALALAGGRWSPARLRDHCEAHIAEDFSSCAGPVTLLHGNFLDGAKKAVAMMIIRNVLSDETWYTHTDPRIQAIVAGVPFAADFDPASLAAPRVPLGLVTAGQDRWLVPAFHSGPIVKACTTCERVADLPGAGHGALLSPLPPADTLRETVAYLLGDPPGFDRSVLPKVDAQIADFFRRHLLP